MPTYETISGHSIEYEADAATLRYLKRVQTLAADPKATEGELIALIFAEDNPVLDRAVVPGRGYVTAAVLENKVYQVMSDLLHRKRLVESGTTPEQEAAQYTVTVAEAAKQLGVHENAIRQAIEKRRVLSWIKGGKHYLAPVSVEHLGTKAKRGPLPKDAKPLEYRAGYDPESKTSFRLKSAGITPEYSEHGSSEGGDLPRWRRVGVLSGGGGRLRFFVLEPGQEQTELVFGPFYVRGQFRIAEKVNNAADARKAFDAFEPV
jgi:hypothetical protein